MCCPIIYATTVLHHVLPCRVIHCVCFLFGVYFVLPFPILHCYLWCIVQFDANVGIADVKVSMDVGKLIAQARMAKSLTQKDLATVCIVCCM
jgi:hypothetical protein